MKQDNIELSRLLDLIERYYDCSLSDDEERRLRQTIAGTALSHPAIDELRALMGFRRPRQPKRLHYRAAVSIAAAVALIVTLGAGLLRHSSACGDYEQTCIAYVNGTCITDENDIISLISSDLSDFDNGSDEAAATFRDELGDFAAIVDNYESDINFPEI